MVQIRRILVAIWLILWLTSSPVQGDVRLPRLFGDHMILQQEMDNCVWGWADPGETIVVSASWGARKTTKADAQGRWRVMLPTPAHGTGFSLTIQGNNTLRFQDVAIGEVWLCAGQSNMGWSTANSFEAEGEADVDLPGFRIFKSQREHWHEPLEESRDLIKRWKPCDPASAAETSAVAYYFGKTLHQKLDIPVGIIVQAYAGTPIEGWMPWEIQQTDARAIAHRATLDTNAQRRMARGDTVEKSLQLYQQEWQQYRKQVLAGDLMKNASRVRQPPFITKPAQLGHQYPGHIYHAMIMPVRPYGIRGMIWYQGERNSKDVPQAVHYQSQLTRLIQHYRSSWHEQTEGQVSDQFPVQLTQLPSWNPAQSQPVEGLQAPWSVNRESMRQVARELPQVGLVVSIDTGDAIALHPKNKKPIGIRHALLALQSTYGQEIVGSGPRLKSSRVAGDRVELHFDSIGSGLRGARTGSLGGFAIAGEDRKWHFAEARIRDRVVEVFSPQVPQPVAVRYAWAMNPSQQNLLYNAEGLPASPFRTDSWPLYEDDSERVEVLKPEKPAGYEAVDWKRPEIIQAR